MLNMNKTTNKQATERLGVDIGGVVINRIADDTDTSFFDQNYLRTPAVKGVFSSLRRLVNKRFGPGVYLVSKCGPNVERKTREWLDHRLFFARTGIPHENVRFCRQRHEKAEVCRELGITHFVDDRLEVLGYLQDVPNRYLFHATEEEVREHESILAEVRRVDSWRELLAELLPN